MIHTFAFPLETTKFEKDDVFVGRAPNRMIVGLLDSRAFDGDLEYYQFAFHKFGLTKIRQLFDDEVFLYETLQFGATIGS